MNKEEIKVINKRLRKGRGINVIYKLFKVIPMNKRKIVFTTFEGNGGYCCNPRYIAEELLNRKLDLKMVWLLNDMSKAFPEGIKKVKNTFLNRVYHLSTAKIWIDNTRKPLGTLKRKEQIYLQTWHAGIGLKAVGKFRGESFPKIAEIISEADSDLIDILISNSDWCTEVCSRRLLYKGEVMQVGLPRCDVLVNNHEYERLQLHRKYGVSESCKVVLYAPTFRGGSQAGSRKISFYDSLLNFDDLITSLENKFEKEFILLLRMHPQLSLELDKMPIQGGTRKVIDVSKADDMNELLTFCDVFITDYSSACFDAMTAKIPTFLHLDDLAEYQMERGSLMFDLSDLPFGISKSNGDLIENINVFSEEDYLRKIERFSKKVGLCETGKSCESIADWIEGIIDV